MSAVPETTTPDASTKVVGLRSQYGPGLLGVPREGLRLSWRVESDRRRHAAGRRTSSPRPQRERRRSRTASSTARHPSASRSLGALAPRERRAYAVRIATAEGWTDWSDPLVVEAGVDGPDLAARVIGIPSELGGPVPLLRREFTLAAAPSSARLRLSALGLVDAWINGVRASDALLTPGWTSYQERILVDTVDVTGLLRPRASTSSCWRSAKAGTAAASASPVARRSTATASARSRSSRWTARSPSSPMRPGQADSGRCESASIYDGTEIDLRLAEDVHAAGFAGGRMDDGRGHRR